MLYRIVRPMKRSGSSFDQFQQRIPAEVRRLLPANGLNLVIPLGDSLCHRVTVFPAMKAIRFSLRTRDFEEAKIRNAEVAAYLQKCWRALREGRDDAHAATPEMIRDPPNALEREFGPLLLWSAQQARNAAIRAHARHRMATGDYLPNVTVDRFLAHSPAATAPVSLTALLDGWHAEAGRKPSTYESYRSTITKFIAFLGHDDVARVTKQDVIRFKDDRLASINPRTKRKLSPRTVKNNDLAALNVIFGWAVANGKLEANPAVGVVIKVGTSQQVRSKGFTPDETGAILRVARDYVRTGGHESQQTAAAKHWVPLVLAYTGARVGEIAQLRKQDVKRVGEHWILTITPEAGTVKTNKYRDVVIHEHLIELGFVEFVNQAREGHLFLNVLPGGDVRGPLRGLKNRLQEFVRTIVTDPNVQPNHGWRHTFKTLGIGAGIEGRVLDAIQGHAPRSVGDTYGHVPHEALAEAMRKFRRFEIPD